MDPCSYAPQNFLAATYDGACAADIHFEYSIFSSFAGPDVQQVNSFNVKMEANNIEHGVAYQYKIHIYLNLEKKKKQTYLTNSTIL